MPLHDLRAIYEVLFRDGVMVAKKDKRPQVKHPEVQSVSNLQVIRAMGSLKSRGYVTETFAWRHFYWYLTNEGIVYLRDYLKLPPEIVPASLQRVRKPAATLAIAHRAARVQSVEGPTSYVPKPGRRGEAESQEALADRQGYRHKMMGSGERESYTDRTPRFRGRPLAAEPVRPKASWDVEDQSQQLLRRGNGFRTEAAMMEESRVKRGSRQQPEVSGERPVTMSQERRVSEVQNEKLPGSVPVQTAAFKQDVSQTTLTSASTKTALPLVVAAVAEATGGATSKMPAEPSALKTNKEKAKITDEKASFKSSEMVTSNTFTTILPDAKVKEEKTKKVIVETVKSAVVKTTVETTTDKVKPQAAAIKATAQESSRHLTETTSTTHVITKPANKDVKEEKDQKVKVKEELIKPAEVKAPAETKLDGKAKKTARVTVTQETTKPLPDSPTSKPVLSTDAVKQISKVQLTQEQIDATSVDLSAKPKSDEGPLKAMTQTESSKIQVMTTVKTTVTEIIVKQEKSDVKMIPPVKKDDSVEEAPKVPQVTQHVDATELVKETKQMVEGSSKSKRKKKKSPGEKSINNEEPPETKLEKVIENTPQPKPVITSEPLTVSTSVKTEVSVVEKKAEIKKESEQIKSIPKQTDGKTKEEVPKLAETATQQASVPLDKIPTAPPVELLDNAQVKEKVENSIVSKITQGPLSLKGEVNAKLPHLEPVKSEATLVNKVETVTVQKITQVELIQESCKAEKKTSAPLSGSEKPTDETKSPISTEKAAEESSKSKKKGKGKKQAKAPETETINTKPVLLPEATALPCTDITSLPQTTVKDSPVTASELTEMNLSPKMTPERMCSEEIVQAAAVLSEAPADKGEVEPVLLSVEKIKQEVPKPKTSSTAREAPAAGELASAALAVTAEAAVAQALASPLVKLEEPPRVAQHLATQAAERSTEKRLSESEASKHEEEKKKKRDLKEDTPSVTATPADKAHLSDTCESASLDTDEAAMRRKIVVVEEIVEVKQILSPAGEQSPPPPAQPEVEGEELDLDVLEALAIERALRSGAAGDTVQGASPEAADWDHSLEEPEEKTWPNFVEGWFERVPLNLHPAVPYSLACDAIAVVSLLSLKCEGGLR